MRKKLQDRVASFQDAKRIKEQGLYPYFRSISSAQDTEVIIDGKEVLMFGSNSYLGLTNHPKIKEAAQKAIEKYGTGCAGSRFLNGTLDIHLELENRFADYFGKEAAVLFSTGFQVNLGVISCLLDRSDYLVLDEYDHASIIDGVRLCKAARYRYENSNMDDLEQQLIKANEAGARFKLIVTDGVFSMDGLVAPLDKICDLADKYDAMVMVDECHAAGFIGATGKGTLEAKGVMGRVDIITGTLGKALGGAMGGYTTAKKEIIELLRQRSRPYLFSNSLAPAIVGASIKVFELLEKDTTLRDKLEWNTNYFKKGMKEAGFDVIDGDSAIVPVMLYDAKLSQDMANELLKEGVYVIGFFFPVVPKDKARIRVQLSAGHTKEHLDVAIQAFTSVGKRLNII